MAPFVATYELVLGALIIVGFQTRLVGARRWRSSSCSPRCIAHTNFADPNQVNHFLKCLGVIGGCLRVHGHRRRRILDRRQDEG